MNHAKTIESAVRQAQDVLWENVPSTHNLPDHDVLEKICVRLDCELTDFLFVRREEKPAKKGVRAK